MLRSVEFFGRSSLLELSIVKEPACLMERRVLIGLRFRFTSAKVKHRSTSLVDILIIASFFPFTQLPAAVNARTLVNKTRVFAVLGGVGTPTAQVFACFGFEGAA